MNAAPIVQVASPITILIDGKACEFSSLEILAKRFAELERTAQGRAREVGNAGDRFEFLRCAVVEAVSYWDRTGESPMASLAESLQRFNDMEKGQVQGGEVPELLDSDDAWQDAAFRGTEYSAGFAAGYNLARSRANSHLAPPHPDTVEEFEAPPQIPMGTALQRLGLRLSEILDGDVFTGIERDYLNPAILELEQARRAVSPHPDTVVVSREECVWTSDGDDDPDEQHWMTECGASWMTMSGTPDDNDMRYCPMCGKRIALRAQAQPATEREGI